MSRSRRLTASATSHNLPGPSTTPSSATTTTAATTTTTVDPPKPSSSRPHTPPHDHSRAQPSTSTSSSSPMRSIVHDPNPRSPIPRGVIRPAHTHPDLTPQPSPKRIRTKSGGGGTTTSPERSGGALASPSSDSQSGRADSEADTKKKESGDAANAPPPKKKRTRTLTTPHQAAVLHALLAQSRFPTTAMREEVGRSIGLSARKVQIWFQNQRQKARRPRNQGDTSTSSQPPQFGPYPSATPQAPASGSYPSMSGVIGLYSQPGPSRPLEHAQQPSPDRFRHHSVPLTETVSDDPPRLLGPGMPGTETYDPRPTRGHAGDWPLSAPPTEGHFSTGTRVRYDSRPLPPLSSQPYPMTSPRPTTSQPRGWRERDMSRTLPPLVPIRPATSSSLGVRHSFHLEPQAPSLHVNIPPLAGRRTNSPESIFAHQLPEPTSTRPVTLPPPYTLEPRPQWDEAAYNPVTRPSSSWSRPDSRSSDKRSISPPSSRLPELARPTTLLDSSPLRHSDVSGGDRTPPPSAPVAQTRVASPPPVERRAPSPGPVRQGRYDPVRGIFVPFPRQTSPTTTPASQEEKAAPQGTS
ncbi:hypothetical protein CC2G_004588 [Coprinopsis cinerea AmutBmut pab1-1]|nr:hypothetical protein CC2G_004588 [Coprinopsis cinerea AmutBmut pab1-1]